MLHLATQVSPRGTWQIFRSPKHQHPSPLAPGFNCWGAWSLALFRHRGIALGAGTAAHGKTAARDTNPHKPREFIPSALNSSLCLSKPNPITCKFGISVRLQRLNGQRPSLDGGANERHQTRQKNSGLGNLQGLG